MRFHYVWHNTPNLIGVYNITLSQINPSVRWEGGICSILLSTWPYKLPTNENTNTAAKVVALHEEMTSDAALGGDVQAYLRCAVSFFWQDKLPNTQDNKLQLMKPVSTRDRPPSAPSRRRSCLCAFWLGTLTHHMSIFLQGDLAHAVLSMRSLPFYKSCWNVHVIIKNAKYNVIFIECYNTA